jgi:hypothetical protein
VPDCAAVSVSVCLCGIQLYAKVATYLFPPAALLTSIPVFSVIIRYNLIENEICGKIPANLFAVVFPWIAALFFYAGVTPAAPNSRTFLP